MHIKHILYVFLHVTAKPVQAAAEEMKRIAVHIAAVFFAFCSSTLTTGMLSESLLKRSLAIGDGFDLSFECSSDTLETYWKSLSVGCADFLTAQSLNQSTFLSSSRGLCEQCGEPLYELVRDCVDDSARINRLMDVLCAANERGGKCYEAFAEGEEMFSDCGRNPCSGECKRDLEASNMRHGCCMFSSIAALSDEQRANQLWSRCDIQSPDLCVGAFTASSESDVDTTQSQSSATGYQSTVIICTALLAIMFR